MPTVRQFFRDTVPLKAVLNATDDAVLFVERGTRIVLSCNAAAERLFMCRAKDLVGETTERLHVDRDEYERFGLDIAQRLRRERSVIRRVSLRRFDGAEFLAEIHVFTLSARHGPGLSLSVIQKVPEATIAASGTAQQERALADLLRSLCEAHGWVCGEVWMPRPEGYLEYGITWSSEPERTGMLRELSCLIRYKPDEGMPGRVWATQKPEWLMDLRESPTSLFRRKFVANAIGLRSALAVPLLNHDECKAVLMFFGNQPAPDIQVILPATMEALNDAAKWDADEVRGLGLADETTEGIYRPGSPMAPIKCICDPDTHSVLDTRGLISVWNSAVPWNPSGHVADVLARVGRHLVDHTHVAPSGRGENGYCPYWFRAAAGETKWGVLQTKYVAAADGGQVLEATVFDDPPDNLNGTRGQMELLDNLTPRERQVLRLTFQGMSSKQLARKLGISHRTVETHRTAIMRKFKVRSFARLMSDYGQVLGF